MTAPLSLERPALAERSAAPPLPLPGVGWIFLCVAIQIGCQLSLLVPGLSPARVVARSLSIGISLVLLFVVPGRPYTRHRVKTWLGVVFVILCLSALNPEGAGPVAILAHLSFYVAVFAPVFWVARLNCHAKALGYVLITIWAFSTASASVGVLQAYFPGRFLPPAGFWVEYGPKGTAALMIQLANGASIPRPPGLTDVPGGAVGGSFYAVLLGMGIALLKPFPFARVAAALSALAGMTCLYLCQFRSSLIMLGVCVLASVGLFAIAGRGSRAASVAFASGAFVLVGFVIALSLGGDSVTNRLETLTAEAPSTVYYNSRGRMVERAFIDSLPEYPLGAGLGRWGMVSHYFSAGGRGLWAEVQWAGWIFDGGLAMLIAYPTAVLLVLAHSIRLALRKTEDELEVWATVIAGYNVGALALTFSYAIFMSASGVEFWLINAGLIQAGALYAARAEKPPDEPADAALPAPGEPLLTVRRTAE